MYSNIYYHIHECKRYLYFIEKKLGEELPNQSADRSVRLNSSRSARPILSRPGTIRRVDKFLNVSAKDILVDRIILSQEPHTGRWSLTEHQVSKHHTVNVLPQCRDRFD